MNLVKTFYGVWTKTGGVLTRLNDEEHQELLKRFAGVAPAVLKDQPKVLEVYNTVKRVAARLRAK